METDSFIEEHWSEFPVTYNTRDLLLYAVGIGCAKESRTGHDSNHANLRFIYEQDERFAAFPTYPLVLSQKGTTVDVDTKASSDNYLGTSVFRKRPTKPLASKPPLRLKGTHTMVDAERFVERVRDIPVKDVPPMRIRSRLIGIQNKGTGALVETESELVGPDDIVYYRFNGGGFHIGATDFQSSGRTNSITVQVPTTRKPDAEVREEVSPEQAHLYRLSADYNPQHIDPNAPSNAMFGAPILHGLCTLGFGARAVLNTMGDNDPQRFLSMKVRFASPVVPGDTLVTKMWKAGPATVNSGAERVVFTTESATTGKVVLANAFMDILHAPSAAPGGGAAQGARL